MPDYQQEHNAVGHAGWIVAHNLACLLIEKGVISHEDVIAMYRGTVDACVDGDPVLQSAAILLETQKTHHECYLGLVAN